MLIRALQINISRRRQPPRLQHKRMRRSGLKPDIDNIHHLLIIFRDILIAEKILRRPRIPGIRPFFGENLDHPRHHRRIPQRFMRGFINENRNRPPQARCREIHQSGRDFTIERILFRPISGTNRVPSIAANAFSRIFSSHPSE